MKERIMFGRENLIEKKLLLWKLSSIVNSATGTWSTGLRNRYCGMGTDTNCEAHANENGLQSKPDLFDIILSEKYYWLKMGNNANQLLNTDLERLHMPSVIKFHVF